METEKISLPNGKLLETKEIWLSDETDFLERKIVRNDLEFVAVTYMLYESTYEQT